MQAQIVSLVVLHTFMKFTDDMTFMFCGPHSFCLYYSILPQEHEGSQGQCLYE